jgi:hypothetical protein|nr:MAG TPA: hypothetical protein [Caudoviricetes sp.]
MNIIVQLLLFELTKLRTWSLLSKELAVNLVKNLLPIF